MERIQCLQKILIGNTNQRVKILFFRTPLTFIVITELKLKLLRVPSTLSHPRACSPAYAITNILLITD